MLGLVILGPMFSGLSVPVVVIVWIVALAALATACSMYSLVFIWLFAILMLSLTGF